MLKVLFRVLLRFERNPYPLANILGGILCAVLSGIAIALISGLETMWLFPGFFALLFVLYNEIVRRSFFLTGSDVKEDVEAAEISLSSISLQVWRIPVSLMIQ